MMKITRRLMAALLLVLITAAGSLAQECETIQGGYIYLSDGTLIETGYDDWGYNYQARIFNGMYCDAYHNAPWCQPYNDVDLVMKWNDAWLNNKDCDLDGILDRHYGYENYKGSGAWVTNHQSGRIEVDGKMRKWTYFIKIVAAPMDAYTAGGIWFTSDGEEIGQQIWGDFAIIQQIVNDPSTGDHGILYKSPVGPGLGNI